MEYWYSRFSCRSWPFCKQTSSWLCMCLCYCLQFKIQNHNLLRFQNHLNQPALCAWLFSLQISPIIVLYVPVTKKTKAPILSTINLTWWKWHTSFQLLWTCQSFRRITWYTNHRSWENPILYWWIDKIKSKIDMRKINTKRWRLCLFKRIKWKNMGSCFEKYLKF